VPEPEPDPAMTDLDREREELSRENPDTGPLIAQTPGTGEDQEETQLGTVFGSGS
jgi:hypothetical protein